MKTRIINRTPIGNPRRIWKQDNFVLSTFSARGEDMREVVSNCAEAGFTMLELGWATHRQAQEALAYCEQEGIDLLYQDFSEHGGMQQHHLEHKLSLEEAKAITQKLRPWKRNVGIYVWDEPYEIDQMKETRRQMDLFQSLVPEKLYFTVAIPSYNDKYRWENKMFADYLERYAEIIDPVVLSLDYYPIGLPGYTKEKQLDDSRMWCDLGQMRKVGREHDMPLWFYYQALAMHGWNDFSFTMTRMMMYAACLYGAKGLQQFTAVGSTILESGEKGPFFEEQKAIHREFHKLGDTLMALENQYVFHSRDLTDSCPDYTPFIDEIESSAVLKEALPSRISVGELTDPEQNVYLMILNRDFETDQAVTLKLRAPARVWLVSREDGKQHPYSEGNDLSVTLPKGDVALFRIQPLSEEPAAIEYRLVK